MQYVSIMAGILDQLIRPQKRAVVSRSDPKTMELEAAREILAEVFKINPSEVGEMIESRLEKVPALEACRKEDGLWPLELWVEG
jgi:hypothetical protein